MYENITYALLLNRMLEKALSINNNLDTVNGSPGVAWQRPRRRGTSKPVYPA